MTGGGGRVRRHKLQLHVASAPSRVLSLPFVCVARLPTASLHACRAAPGAVPRWGTVGAWRLGGACARTLELETTARACPPALELDARKEEEEEHIRREE